MDVKLGTFLDVNSCEGAHVSAFPFYGTCKSKPSLFTVFVYVCLDFYALLCIFVSKVYKIYFVRFINLIYQCPLGMELGDLHVRDSGKREYFK